VRALAFAVVVLLSTSSAAVPRVFLTPLRATDVAPGVTDLLVSARRHQALFDVVGAADVKGVLDVESARAALGCDSESCANEIADALAAEQVLTGQLGRVGNLWLLTLTRTDRKTLQVLARASVEAHGDSPEVLLPLVPQAVDEVLGIVQERGAAGSSPPSGSCRWSPAGRSMRCRGSASAPPRARSRSRSPTSRRPRTPSVQAKLFTGRGS
jgi:hypothetical protein